MPCLAALVMVWEIPPADSVVMELQAARVAEQLWPLVRVSRTQPPHWPQPSLLRKHVHAACAEVRDGLLAVAVVGVAAKVKFSDSYQVPSAGPVAATDVKVVPFAMVVVVRGY